MSRGRIPYDSVTAGRRCTGAGNLSGYGWSETAGWINFNPTHGQVTIDAEVFDSTDRIVLNGADLDIEIDRRSSGHTAVDVAEVLRSIELS